MNNLEHLTEEARNKLSSLKEIPEVTFAEEIINELKPVFENYWNGKCIFHNRTFTVETSQGHYAIMPNQYFFIAKELFDLALVLRVTFDDFDEHFRNDKDIRTIVNSMQDLIKKGTQVSVKEHLLQESQKIKLIFSSLTAARVDNLCYLLGNLRDSKKFGNTDKDTFRTSADLFGSYLLNIAPLTTSESGSFGDLMYVLTSNTTLYEELADSLIEEKTITLAGYKKKTPYSHNRIIFGAPGTGKSHKLEEDSRYFKQQEKTFVTKPNLEKEIHDELIKLKTENIDGLPEYAYEVKVGVKYSTYLKKLMDSGVTGQNFKDRFGIVGNGDYLKYGALSCKSIESTSFVERVTFHPNYSYAQFVGTYKPIAKKTNLTEDDCIIQNTLADTSKSAQEKYDLLWDIFDKRHDRVRLPMLVAMCSNDDDAFTTRNEDGTNTDLGPMINHGKALRQYVELISRGRSNITYEYVPGPFMRTYVSAKKTPNKDFLLLIEEINRANVAAVFGDVFQLLDRDDDGKSQYPIAASEDQKNYLESCGINEDEIAIPSNMYIWATMNSADQGVMPMDAAFKRRWDFEYLDVDANESAANFIIPITKDGSKTVSWNDFRKALNEKMSDIGINEDKLLGPFFLSKKTLENALTEPEKFVELFESKVIMYLFEDVVKMQPGKLFNTNTRRYSKICQEFENKGMELFGLTDEVVVKEQATSEEE